MRKKRKYTKRNKQELPVNPEDTGYSSIQEPKPIEIRTKRDRAIYDKGELEARYTYERIIGDLKKELKEKESDQQAQRFNQINEMIKHCAQMQEACTRLVMTAEKQF